MNKHTRRTITLTETWTMTWKAAGYAQAQTSSGQLSQAPNLYAHWGAFPSDHPLRNVLPVAEAALAQVGLQIYSQAFHAKYSVTGGNGHIMVIVTCIPEGEQSWVVVYAAAPDSALAEDACAAIRELIGKPAVVAMLNAYWLDTVGTTSFSEAGLRANWEQPGLDYTQDVCLAVDASGVIGYGAATCRPPYVNHFLLVCTHPSQRGRGIGTALTEWGEQRSAECLPLAPPDTQVTIGCNNFGTHQAGAQLLRNLGYQHVRSGPLEFTSAACWPIKQIAGLALGFPKDNEYPDMCWVQSLGVRRPWRRRGLALALLHHIFGECYRRSIYKVGLGVDAGSLTNATRLYERAGMQIFRRWDNYEKVIRAGQDLVTRTIAD